MPRNLNETERRHINYFCFVSVEGGSFAQEVHQNFFVRVALHVDEVDDYNPAEVAKFQLLEEKFRRLQICFQNRFVEVGAPDKFSGIHVDGSQSFGFIDNNLPAARQGKFALIDFGNFFRHAERLENLRVALVKSDVADFSEPPKNFQVVDEKFCIFGVFVAKNFFNQIVVVEERGRFAFVVALKNFFPKSLKLGKFVE